MNYSKVDGHSNLIRDEETKAILNTNMNEYYSYLNQKNLKEKLSNPKFMNDNNKLWLKYISDFQ